MDEACKETRKLVEEIIQIDDNGKNIEDVDVRSEEFYENAKMLDDVDPRNTHIHYPNLFSDSEECMSMEDLEETFDKLKEEHKGFEEKYIVENRPGHIYDNKEALLENAEDGDIVSYVEDGIVKLYRAEAEGADDKKLVETSMNEVLGNP